MGQVVEGVNNSTAPRVINNSSVLDLSGVGGLTPSGASQTPKFSLTPTGLVKNSQKYIADPPLVLPQIEYCEGELINLRPPPPRVINNSLAHRGIRNERLITRSSVCETTGRF